MRQVNNQTTLSHGIQELYSKPNTDTKKWSV